MDFLNLEYLSSGNPRQRLAYKELQDLRLFDLLKDFDPLLAGTIPIGIDLPGSDLDVLCCCLDHEHFAQLLKFHFQQYPSFRMKRFHREGVETSLCNFFAPNFEIEIFAQDEATHQQRGFQHMLIEHRILQERGPAFRDQIIRLKQSGVKTEPAFAQLLGLQGDPYEALLKWR